MGSVQQLTKDGDSGGEVFVSNYTIEIVCNGYILHIIYDDEEESREVFISKDELIRQLKKYL